MLICGFERCRALLRHDCLGNEGSSDCGQQSTAGRRDNLGNRNAWYVQLSSERFQGQEWWISLLPAAVLGSNSLNC